VLRRALRLSVEMEVTASAKAGGARVRDTVEWLSGFDVESYANNECLSFRVAVAKMFRMSDRFLEYDHWKRDLLKVRSGK